MPVIATVSVARAERQLGTRLAFEARVSALAASDGAAFRVRSGGDASFTGPPASLDWSAGRRVGFADAAARLGGDGGALVPGLTIGDTSAVSSEDEGELASPSLGYRIPEVSTVWIP